MPDYDLKRRKRVFLALKKLSQWRQEGPAVGVSFLIHKPEHRSLGFFAQPGAHNQAICPQVRGLTVLLNACGVRGKCRDFFEES